VITYAYLNNQMVTVTVNGTPVVANAKYFPFGGVSGWTWGNGQVYQRTYDQDGRIQSVTLAGQTRTYGFDDASRITALTDRQGAAALQSATIAYDNLDRLTSAVNPASYNQTFVYDLVGNRTSETVSGASTALGYGAASNRLVQNGTQTISYDNSGNTTSDGTFSYSYSGRNRLVQVSQGASTLATYKHNALGQRVAKTLGGTTTLFAYDEAGHLLGEYDSSGGMIQETVWMYDTPVATLRRSGLTTTIHYVWADNLDTPRAVTTSDAASTLEWKWDSDPFGTTSAQQVAITYNLRFPGQYFDQETGTHYNYFRDYDPSVGRYVESDPQGLAAGLNTYSYGLDSPVGLSDMYGLDTKYSGTIINIGLVPGLGAQGYRFHLTSECKCNKIVTIDGIASLAAAGIGAKLPHVRKDASGGGAHVEMSTIFDCPSETDADGPASAVGINYIPGVGFSFASRIGFGRLSTGFHWSEGHQFGLDVSATVGIGWSGRTSFSIKPCCSEGAK
jgi:RHS repeat-associated protein